MSTSILVVGAGSIGQRHASNLAALGADVAITDTDSARLVGVPWRTAAGIADGFDAIVIASPTTCHAEQALAALDTGAAVFVEKPLALTVDEGERLVEVGGERITVGYNLRFHEPLRRLAQLMAAGRAGRPLSYRFWFGQWLPDWRPTVDYRQTYSACATSAGECSSTPSTNSTSPSGWPAPTSPSSGPRSLGSARSRSTSRTRFGPS
ncbi:MAG: Gfo/Idh/MocA family oxidoreductase [Microthrixaceae bacterium]